MSSPIKIDSLSELARIVEEVDMFATGMCAISRDQFEQLKEQINALQVLCPNHKGVLAARVKWYEFALESFERYLAARLEEGRPMESVWYPDRNHSPDLLCGMEALEPFMRRQYLKDAFPRLYKELIQLLLRAAEAIKRNYSLGHESHRQCFLEIIQDLENRLLEGRL